MQNVVSCKWSILTMWPFCAVKDLKPQTLRSHNLTSWSDVTSSITWLFDSSPAIYCTLSTVTMHLSCTVMEIWCLKRWTNAHTGGRMHRRTDRRPSDFIVCPMLCLQPQGNTLQTSGKKFSMITSSPVTICMLSSGIKNTDIDCDLRRYQSVQMGFLEALNKLTMQWLDAVNLMASWQQITCSNHLQNIIFGTSLT